jgi:hypothetical protein
LYLPLISPYFSSQFTCNMIFSLLTCCSQCETYFLVHPFHISNSGSLFHLKTGFIFTFEEINYALSLYKTGYTQKKVTFVSSCQKLRTGKVLHRFTWPNMSINKVNFIIYSIPLLFHLGPNTVFGAVLEYHFIFFTGK